MEVTDILFDWQVDGAARGYCRELLELNERDGVMAFKGYLTLPHGHEAIPSPISYIASSGRTSYGRKFAMLDSVVQEDEFTVNDDAGGFDEEGYGGSIVLFPTYIVRATFRVITEEEFISAIESFKEERREEQRL